MEQRSLSANDRSSQRTISSVTNVLGGHPQLFDYCLTCGGCVAFPRYLGEDGVESFCRRAVEEHGVPRIGEAACAGGQRRRRSAGWPVMLAMRSKSLSRCSTVSPASSAAAAISRSGIDGARCWPLPASASWT